MVISLDHSVPADEDAKVWLFTLRHQRHPLESNGSAGLTFAATGGTKYGLAMDDAYGNGDVFKLIFSP
jgi:hypothetical protein